MYRTDHVGGWLCSTRGPIVPADSWLWGLCSGIRGRRNGASNLSPCKPVRPPGVSKLELGLGQPPLTGDRSRPCPCPPTPALSASPFGTARGELWANLPPFRPTSDLRPSLHALSIFTGAVPVDAILGPCAPVSGVFGPQLFPRSGRTPRPTEVADGGGAGTGLCSPGSFRDAFIPGDFPDANTGGASPLSAYGPAGDGAGL